MENTKQFYSVQEIMTLFGVCDETVYRWIQSGKLLAHRIGGQWRISEESLEGFIEGK